MKTIDDLLEYVKTLKEEPELKPGKDGTSFDLVFDKKLMNERLEVLRSGKYSGRPEISMIEQMRDLQQEYMKTMHKLNGLTQVELTKIKNDK